MNSKQKEEASDFTAKMMAALIQANYAITDGNVNTLRDANDIMYGVVEDISILVDEILYGRL